MSRRTFNVLGGISYILGLVGIAFSQEKIANVFELSFLQLNVAKVLAVVFLICIVMEYIIPAMMILVVLIANIFVSIYTNKYYQKKF